MHNPKSKTTKTFFVEMEDRPGALLKLLAQLREGKVELLGSWSWSESDGKARCILIAEDPAKTGGLLNQGKYTYETSEACLVERSGTIDEYADILKSLADSNINLTAANAVSINGTLFTALWSKQADFKKLQNILNDF